MWYIIWHMNKRTKVYDSSFSSKEKALQYAKYYTELYHKHARALLLKNPFSKTHNKTQDALKISYMIKKINIDDAKEKL